MAFYDVRFPVNISYGSSGGPGFATTIIGLEGGSEQRVARWSNARRRYNVAYGVKTYADLQDIITFFVSVKGAAHGFRYKDWTEYTTAADGSSAFAFDDVALATYDGSTDTFQLAKRYSVTQGTETTTAVIRNITKPVKDQVKMGLQVGGTGTVTELDALGNWSVDFSTGIVTVVGGVSNGDTLYCGCEFDIPVRFSKEIDSLMSVSLDSFDTGSAEAVELVELTSTDEFHDEFFYGGASDLSFSSDISISASNGRVIVATPSTAGLTMTLPDPSTLPAGGPHFVIFNESATASLGLSDSGAHGGSSNALAYTIPASGQAELLISQFADGSNQWRAWESG